MSSKLTAPWLTDILSRLKLHSDYDSDDELSDELICNTFRSAIWMERKLVMNWLDPYDVPPEIKRINQNERVDEAVLSTLSQRISGKKSQVTKSIERYKTMIYLEETAQSQFLAEFNTNNIRLEWSREEKTFHIKVDKSVTRIVEAIDENLLDWFTLKPSQDKQCSTPICGQIKKMNKEYIIVDISENFTVLRDNCNQPYDIFFHVNRVPYQLQHNALDFVCGHRLFYLLLKNPTYDEAILEKSTSSMNEDYIFRGKLALKLNMEQKSAVVNIVKAKNFPLPYLLFGPAGTGKTSTLVAAIEEIVRSTDNNVLVCANSNAACDEITERLVDVLNFGEMFRMYAKSCDFKNVSDRIKPICNWKIDELNPKRAGFEFPSPIVLSRFRVLVCTLCTSGCLVRSTSNSFKRFSHVIIDECASTHETMSLIPIAGLCTSLNKVNSSIVLAGDPKQLDAVTKSNYAVRLGFKTSFMENLFKKKLYQRNPSTDKYNSIYITQLVKNYRSHAAILHIPNKLFYDNKLEVKAAAEKTDWYIGSKMIPSKQFPIIFQSVQGFCRRSAQDVSLFNAKEVDVVIDYIDKLLKNKETPIAQSDIGVVTPYKLQTKKIKMACRRNNFNDITIGTAEVFQGQERPVIIVSTVRTGGVLGFVNDPRRLNVIITRAKCLLIIVGDPHTLRFDRNWFTLIQYCMQNKALIQGEKPFNLQRNNLTSTFKNFRL